MHIRIAAFLLSFVLAVTISLSFSRIQAPAPPTNIPVVGRSMVMTTYGIVAASQPLAAGAGVQILERGGNAVDAAIAANSTLGLMEPTSNGMGGDLFAIIYEAKTGRIYGLNSSGWSAGGMTPELLEAKGLTRMPARGAFTVTVPGAVAGWDALRSRFGTKPFAELLAPAIFYARNGFPVTEVIAGSWGRSTEFLASQPNSRATFLPGGGAPKAGETFRNPDLAASLERIAARGRDGYYKGPTAEAIVAILNENGNPMTLDDLSGFEPEWVTPIETTYRGWRVAEIPPNTQGIAALIMLNIMSRFPLASYGFHSANALHVMIEAKKLAYADMLRYVGDPKFSRIPVEELLSADHAQKRAALIDESRANCDVPPAVLTGVTDSRGSDTIYMTVVDKDGNIVSLIQSNYSGFGSGLVPAGTGFMLQNRGALFTLQRNHPNTLAPHKRPLHTIIPAFMRKDDVAVGFGIMGGWNQAQAHAQFVANIADYGMTLQEALEAGRFTKGTFEGCDVNLEALIPERSRTDLEALGHKVRVVPPRTGSFGYGQAVSTRSDGTHFGASEPRHDGAAIPQAPPVFGPAPPSP